MTDEATENAIAKIIYDAMRWAYQSAGGEMPPAWEPWGNSDAQTEARRRARTVQAHLPTVAESGKVILSDLDNLWTAGMSTDTHNARQKATRDGHKYRVVDREGFRAALRALTPPAERG